MPIEVKCPGCAALLRIADENLGRKSRCPNCALVFTAERASVESRSAESPFVAPLSDAGGPAEAWQRGMGSQANPYAPTYSEPQRPFETGPLVPRPITVDEVITKSWLIFKKHWVMVCVVVAILGGVNVIGNVVQNVMTGIANVAINEPVVTLAIQFSVMVIVYALQVWLQLGQTMVMLDVARGRPINISKLFAGGQFLLQGVIAMIVVSLVFLAIAAVLVGIPAGVGYVVTQSAEGAGIGAVLGGLVALVPVTLLALAISQYLPLIVDRNLNAIEALKRSVEITKGNKFTLFLIGVVLTGISIVGAIIGLLMFCVGLFPAMIGVGAFSSLVFVVAYLSMTSQLVVIPGSANDPTAASFTGVIP